MTTKTRTYLFSVNKFSAFLQITLKFVNASSCAVELWKQLEDTKAHKNSKYLLTLSANIMEYEARSRY